MTQTRPPRHRYRDAPVYGWPFYAARRALRGTAGALSAAADALATREKYAVGSLFGPLLPQNQALRGRHRGRRAFVIGNGPSVAGQDLAPLAGEVTLVMNAFLRHPLMDLIRPTYYLFADPLYFDGSDSSRRFLADVRDTVRASTFIAPYAAAPAIRANGWLDPDRTHHVAFAGKLRSARLRDLDLTRTVPHVRSVAQLGIMLALFAGCSHIYLLGTDHDWLAHRGMERHFYQGLTLPNHPVAHGDQAKHGYLAEALAIVELWHGYQALGRLAERRGVQIVNCTDGGFLDVFPRQRYEDVVDAPVPEPRVAAAA